MWTMLDRKVDLGLLPMIFQENDPRPAKEQANDRYRHGGGWNPMPKWTMDADRSIAYPGDPPLYPKAMNTIGDETIILYPHSWVAIIQKDGVTFEVARMD